MNLFLFTIELERARPGDRARARRGRTSRWWLGVGIAVVVSACTAMTALVGWGLAGGDGSVLGAIPDWLPISTASASTEPGALWQVEITSDPKDATVVIDGRKQGQTPLLVQVAAGQHMLRLTQPDAVDYERQISVDREIQLDVDMLRRRPVATQLKPPFPGANIYGVNLLADGRLALSITRPTSGGSARTRLLTEAWIFDPANGTVRPFQNASGPRSAILAVSPDGNRVAYAGAIPSDTRTDSSSQILTDVLVTVPDDSLPVTVFSLPTPTALSAAIEREEVQDIAWTPDGRELLVTVRLHSIGGNTAVASRSRVLLVDVASANREQRDPVELLTLPAEIVPGTYSWTLTDSG